MALCVPFFRNGLTVIDIEQQHTQGKKLFNIFEIKRNTQVYFQFRSKSIIPFICEVSTRCNKL